MKKFIKVASVAMATLMMVSMVPFTSASAAAKKKVESSNVKSGIKLTWEVTQNAGKYTIYRSSKKSGKTTVIGTTKKTAFTDKNVKAGEKYFYKVKTSNGTFYEQEKAVRLNTPTLEKVYLSKYDDVKLQWTAVKGAERYRIYRAKVKADGTVGEYKARWTSKKTKSWDYIMNAGTYRYKIAAIADGCESMMSNAMDILYIPSTRVYPVLSSDYSSIEVTFSPEKGVDGYRIYRASSVDGTEKMIADIPASEANIKVTDPMWGYTYFEDYTYVDTDLEIGIGYVYSIETYIGENTSVRKAQYDEPIYLKHADIDIKVGETYSEISTMMKELMSYYDQAMESDELEGFELNIEATSENPDVATIDENYVITGVAPGETVIVFKVTGKQGDKKLEDRLTIDMTYKTTIYVGE